MDKRRLIFFLRVLFSDNILQDSLFKIGTKDKSSHICFKIHDYSFYLIKLCTGTQNALWRRKNNIGVRKTVHVYSANEIVALYGYRFLTQHQPLVLWLALNGHFEIYKILLFSTVCDSLWQSFEYFYNFWRLLSNLLYFDHFRTQFWRNCTHILFCKSFKCWSIFCRF